MATKSTEDTKMNEESHVIELCDRVRQIAFDLHVFLRHGHLEKVYEHGMVNRIRKSGMLVEQQYPLKVCDEDGAVLGDFFADLFIENCLIVELKACKMLVAEHTAQVLGYLRASKLRHAMLINFGSPKIEIKKLIL